MMNEGIKEYLESQGLNEEDCNYIPFTSSDGSEETLVFIVPKPKDKPIKVVFEEEPLKLNEEDHTIEMSLEQYLRLIEHFREWSEGIDEILGYNDE